MNIKMLKRQHEQKDILKISTI